MYSSSTVNFVQPIVAHMQLFWAYGQHGIANEQFDKANEPSSGATDEEWEDALCKLSDAQDKVADAQEMVDNAREMLDQARN